MQIIRLPGNMSQIILRTDHTDHTDHTTDQEYIHLLCLADLDREVGTDDLSVRGVKNS